MIAQDRMMIERDGTYAVPIKVWVPRECEASTPGSPPDRYEWELTTKAAVSGIDFGAQFTVPMFETDESVDEPPANVEELSLGTEPQPYHPTILVTESAGSLKMQAPPRRNVSVLFSFTFFWIIWTAVCVGLFYSDAPLLFPIVFSLFNLFLTYGVVWSWFGSVAVHFEHDTATIEKTILGFGRRNFINLNDISNVDMHVTMQSGNKPYYALRIHHNSTSTNTFGGLGNKDEVEDLIKLIEDYIAEQH